MNVRLLLRVLLAIIALTAIATIGYAFLTAEGTATEPRGSFQEGEVAVDPPGETTVVTTSQHGNNYLVGFESDGTVAYYDDRYDFYNEVERVPGTSMTVTYVATEQLDRSECSSTETCNRNVIERVNLSTGDRELLHERTNPQDRNQWHAIALLDDRHVVVGDIAFDRVFVLDTETKLIEWEWEAQSDLDLSGGGIYPGDWTHLNDVEVLPDGRLMVSLRNQDQVVFLHPETGLQENWTLGSDGDHDTLYEQHNPDYIPSSGGGPAVLVADSENSRIVEYEREATSENESSSAADSEWRRTWEWSDREMRWPRDADRLSNGNTMIVDSNGGRVFELDREGEIVWSMSVKGAYDVERFDPARDEGEIETAERLGLESRVEGDTSARENVPGATTQSAPMALIERLLPGIVVNGVLYVMPPWFGVREFVAGLALLAAGATWGGLELYWRSYRLRSPLGKRDG